MSSSDHLRGVLSASRDGCFSYARLQLHHRTIDIHTWYWFMQYLVEDPGCHLTLAHWWVYLRDPNKFMSLVISGLCWRQCLESPTTLLYRFMNDATYLYHRDLWLSISYSIQLCTVPYLVGYWSWIYSIPWECHGSNVAVLHISILLQPLIEATIV